jgi:hypothetical protein
VTLRASLGDWVTLRARWVTLTSLLGDAKTFNGARRLLLQVFGQHTASNNSIWLRKKLAEPVAQTGPMRSSQVRRQNGP